MDEPNVYENRSNDDRRVIEEADKEDDQTKDTEDTDAEKARIDRRRRRAGRRAICRCGERALTRPTRKGRRILSQNPFIIFYLEMYYKMPDKHVTEVARLAGKEWCVLPETERMKYVRAAERERRRRRGTRRTRRRRRRI